MNQFMEEYYAMRLKPQFEKQLKDEPFHNIDKYLILNETQTFNNFKFSDENSIIILVQLIYLANQGVQFNQQEVEQLVFRITKLFQSNNSGLREMMYRSLKMIMPQQYVYILIQSLKKDLKSDNPLLKLQALKFIPFIQDEQYVYQIERFVHDALIDTKLSIQSTALIVGIHIVNQFPTLGGKWLFEVAQSLDQLNENLQYHTLILLHEIKKSNLAQFIKIVIQMMKKQSQPFVNLQNIKFIQEILPYTENPHKQELITYLFQQVESRDPLIVFESSKILINDQNIQNDLLVPINQFMEGHINTSTDSILLYNSLRLMLYLTNYENRKSLLTARQISQIYNLAFNSQITVSSLAIQIAIKLDSKYIALQLKQVYEMNIDLKLRNVFFRVQKKLSNLTISIMGWYWNFLEQRIQDQVNTNYLKFLNHHKQNLKDLYEILNLLTSNRGFDFQKNAIKIMNKMFLDKQSTEMGCFQNQLWQKYLYDNNISQIDEDSFNFMAKQYIFIKQYVYEYYNNNTCNSNE
ncbi:hypothetical protein pb186bvf_000754 [Paramecium bursaria]